MNSTCLARSFSALVVLLALPAAAGAQHLRAARVGVDVYTDAMPVATFESPLAFPRPAPRHCEASLLAHVTIGGAVGALAGWMFGGFVGGFDGGSGKGPESERFRRAFVIGGAAGAAVAAVMIYRTECRFDRGA